MPYNSNSSLKNEKLINYQIKSCVGWNINSNKS